MLDGYWLFANADTPLSRDPSRQDEFISLFKHDCLLQRQVTLSDHMVMASPNFRRAYREDSDFRELVLSDIVRIAYTHQRAPRHGVGVMDLVEVKDFHLRHGLGAPDIKEFFSTQGSDGYLAEIHAKPSYTRGEFNGTLRDPLFTAKTLGALGSGYLRRHLGGYSSLFEDVTRAYYETLAKDNVSLGIIHFVAGRERWQHDMIVDLFLDRLPSSLPSQQIKSFEDTIYLFAKSHLTRTESDLMKLDPILPQEEQAYVEVLHDRTVENIIETKNCVGLKVYELSTDLDDALLYRHIDFGTVAEMRKLDEAIDFLEAAEPGPAPPTLSPDDRGGRQERLAERFGDTLIAYRRRLERELSLKFAHAAKPALERTVKLRVANFVDEIVQDEHGSPRRICSTAVECAIAGLSVPFGPVAAVLLRFLSTLFVPHLTKADRFAANFTHEYIKRLTMDALSARATPSKMNAYVAASSDLSAGTGGFTVYTS